MATSVVGDFPAAPGRVKNAGLWFLQAASAAMFVLAGVPKLTGAESMVHVFAAVGLVTLACVLLSWTGGKWGFSLGALGIIAACFLWGLDNNLTRQISGKNPLMIVAIKGLGAGSFSLFLALILGKPFPAWSLLPAALLVGAVIAHLAILGGNPVVPVALLVAMAIVAWGRWERTARLLSR